MNNSATFLPPTRQQEERKKRIMTVDDEADVVFSLSFYKKLDYLKSMGLQIPYEHYLISDQVSMTLFYWILECQGWTALNYTEE
jgi:hypothetical protein